MIKLREIRKERNQTIQEMGKHLGMNPGSLSKYERGERNPKLDVLVHICKAYGVSLATLAPDVWKKVVGAVDMVDLEDELDKREDEARERELMEYVHWQDQQDDYGEHEWEYSEPGYEEDWSDEEN
ncbi:helix-turn-helix domain-containing protein [Ligilactobacillus saerimneri]|uniref:Helix-turn-helix domain-containing protein n=1 Tax=Ligilactobacillus saerimneri TaxID=228229 RepID=A0A7H9EK07_9LACO|nr:helix-turn-helix transcriptional regulator [Ligilactobacillus saerimneri]QLL77612.1 helix-turn-helix domain-containing protein [Ligilactobacillus saerimneri]